MTIEKDIKEMTTEGMTVGEANTAAHKRMDLRGTQRNQRRRSKQRLDETKAGLEILAWNVDAVEEAIKIQLQMRLDSDGGKRTFWEKWLSRVELNWKSTMVDDNGERYFNKPDEMNLHNVADTALRTAVESWSKGFTLLETIKAMGEGFSAYCFFRVLEETRDGRELLKTADRATQRMSSDPEPRRKKALRLAAERGHDENVWHEGELVRCGSILWNAIVFGTNIFVEKFIKEGDDKWKTYYPKLTDETEKMLDERNIELDRLARVYAPIFRPPHDWGMDHTGPYHQMWLSKGTPLVRNANKKHKALIEDALESGQLDYPIKALNTLQTVPYVIHPYVLEAIEWASAKTRVNANDKKEKLDYNRSRKINDFPNLKLIKRDAAVWESRKSKSDIELAEILEDERERVQENTAVRGNREQVKNWVADARFYLEENRQFYMVHNFDRRGRVYHHSDFGHHNTDALRGLFYFARGQAIGDEIGFISLALANNYGADKLPLDKRSQWTEANQEIIIECGRDFTNNSDVFSVIEIRNDGTEIILDDATPYDFWRNADNPFQFLAGCHELAKYADYCERNPGREHEFVSGLPVALDASQSGTQHYAMALRNKSDAVLTNVVPPKSEDDPPNDLYLAVLERAKVLLVAKLEADEAEYNARPLTDDDWAKINQFEAFQADKSIKKEDKKVERERFNRTIAAKTHKLYRTIDATIRIMNWEDYGRSVVKRNAMTYAYSSRAYGFADQIRTDTMKPLTRKVRLGELDEHPFGKDKGFMASHVLAQVHEQAIQDTVQSVAEGMDFFQSCSDVLHSFNLHFGFVTKWGFPMEQYYEEEAKNPYRPSTWLYNNKLAEKVVETVSQRDAMDQTIERNVERLSLAKFNGQVHRGESRQAISPNIIHAQDGLLLQMAVTLCAEANDIRDLMVVHDSFATIPADARVMRNAIRLATVDLYGGDFNLCEEIRLRVISDINDWCLASTASQRLDAVSKLAIDLLNKANRDDAAAVKWHHQADKMINILEQSDWDFETNRFNSEDTEVTHDLLMSVAECCVLPAPEQGDLDVRVVMNSPYYVN